MGGWRGREEGGGAVVAGGGKFNLWWDWIWIGLIGGGGEGVMVCRV